MRITLNDPWLGDYDGIIKSEKGRWRLVEVNRYMIHRIEFKRDNGRWEVLTTYTNDEYARLLFGEIVNDQG